MALKHGALKAGATTHLTGGRLSLLIAASVVLLDQLTKHWATSALGDNPDAGPSIMNGWLSLTYTTNTGAAFGLMADRGVLFLLIGLVVLVIVIAYWRLLPGRRPLLRVSLGLQLGGAAGNVLDRVRDGYVTDFMQIKYWPVFNLADSAIVVGVALLMYHVLWASDAQTPESLTPKAPGDRGGPA